MNAYVLAHVAVEVATMLPDDDKSITRAEYVDKVIRLAESIMQAENITQDTDDIDEAIVKHLIKEV
jgi:hypothetical protein